MEADIFRACVEVLHCLPSSPIMKGATRADLFALVHLYHNSWRQRAYRAVVAFIEGMSKG